MTERPAPAPVTIIRGDGRKDTMSARDFRHRDGGVDVPPVDPPNDGGTLEVSTTELEGDIIRTLRAAMKSGMDTKVQLSAANTAVKFLAVKARIPIPVGGGFDEPD
jgi:hypothetical protein